MCVKEFPGPCFCVTALTYSSEFLHAAGPDGFHQLVMGRSHGCGRPADLLHPPVHRHWSQCVLQLLQDAAGFVLLRILLFAFLSFLPFRLRRLLVAGLMGLDDLCDHPGWLLLLLLGGQRWRRGRWWWRRWRWWWRRRSGRCLFFSVMPGKFRWGPGRSSGGVVRWWRWCSSLRMGNKGIIYCIVLTFFLTSRLIYVPVPWFLGWRLLLFLLVVLVPVVAAAAPADVSVAGGPGSGWGFLSCSFSGQGGWTDNPVWSEWSFPSVSSPSPSLPITWRWKPGDRWVKKNNFYSCKSEVWNKPVLHTCVSGCGIGVRSVFCFLEVPEPEPSLPSQSHSSTLYSDWWWTSSPSTSWRWPKPRCRQLWC